MNVSKELEQVYEVFLNEKIEIELLDLKSIVATVRMLKTTNDHQGYKQGKLFFDVLKVYDLKDFKQANHKVRTAYKIAIDNSKADIALNVAETNCRIDIANKFSLDNLQLVLVQKFVGGCCEVSKDSLRTFWKASNKFDRLIIESDVKNFLDKSYEFQDKFQEVA